MIKRLDRAILLSICECGQGTVIAPDCVRPNNHSQKIYCHKHSIGECDKFIFVQEVANFLNLEKENAVAAAAENHQNI